MARRSFRQLPQLTYIRQGDDGGLHQKASRKKN
jgi:hypothetical protein